MSKLTSLENVLLLHQYICDSARKHIEVKGRDYNRQHQENGDTLANLRSSTNLGLTPNSSVSCLIRAADKMSRLASLMPPDQKEAVKGESVKDTVEDFINYLVYSLIFKLEETGQLEDAIKLASGEPDDDDECHCGVTGCDGDPGDSDDEEIDECEPVRNPVKVKVPEPKSQTVFNGFIWRSLREDLQSLLFSLVRGNYMGTTVKKVVTARDLALFSGVQEHIAGMALNNDLFRAAMAESGISIIDSVHSEQKLFVRHGFDQTDRTTTLVGEGG